MSVMNGFREELIKSLSGINGDFIIYETNDKEISKFQQTYPDAKIVKNYQLCFSWWFSVKQRSDYLGYKLWSS